MRINLFLIATLLLTSAATHAGDNPADRTMDSSAAFARLKALVGEWQADTSRGKAHVTYELIAGGTSLMERETGENMPPMLTVYLMNGNRLMLEHYCMAGNQPRMEARSFDPKIGELRFHFPDATNLAGKEAGHMHNVTIRFVDGEHFSAAWEFHEGGKRKFTEGAEYTRVR